MCGGALDGSMHKDSLFQFGWHESFPAWRFVGSLQSHIPSNIGPHGRGEVEFFVLRQVDEKV